jgi:hypothetical protein
MRPTITTRVMVPKMDWGSMPSTESTILISQRWYRANELNSAVVRRIDELLAAHILVANGNLPSDRLEHGKEEAGGRRDGKYKDKLSTWRPMKRGSKLSWGRM